MRNCKIYNIRQALKGYREKSVLAARLRCTPDTLQKIKAGLTVDPSSSIVDGICRELGLDFETGLPIQDKRKQPGPIILREEAAHYGKRARVRSIPLVGYVSASKPNGTGGDVVVFEHWKQEGAEDEYEIFQVGDEVYARAIRNASDPLIACRVEGDSMKPYYLPGDVLILERTQDKALLRNDDHIVCDIPGDGPTIKLWQAPERGSPALLHPLNIEGHRAFVMPRGTRLVGIVLALIRVRK